MDLDDDSAAAVSESPPVEAPSPPPLHPPPNLIQELLSFGDQQTKAQKKSPEKWPHPVSGAELFDEIVGYLSDFVVLPRHADVILATCAFASYAVHAGCLEIAPRITIRAPDPGCGKTTLMEVLSSVVFNAHPTTDVSVASYASDCNAGRTILIDEMHQIAATNARSRLFALINSGHRRKFAIKETLDGTCNLFTITFMAGIGHFSSAEIDTRSFEIDLLPKRNTDVVKKYVEEDESLRASTIQAKLFRFIFDEAGSIKECKPPLDGFTNRERDNATALAQIADTISPEVGDRVRDALRTFKKKGAVTDGQVFFVDLATLIAEGNLRVCALPNGGGFLFSDEIVEAVAENFPDRQAYDGFNPWKLSHILRGYKVSADTQRKPGAKPRRGYHMRHLQPWFERYGLATETPQQQVEDDSCDVAVEPTLAASEPEPTTTAEPVSEPERDGDAWKERAEKAEAELAELKDRLRPGTTPKRAVYYDWGDAGYDYLIRVYNEDPKRSMAELARLCSAELGVPITDNQIKGVLKRLRDWGRIQKRPIGDLANAA